MPRPGGSRGGGGASSTRDGDGRSTNVADVRDVGVARKPLSASRPAAAPSSSYRFPTTAAANKMSGRESRSTVKKVYAFGSSTPRYLEYLNHIPRQYRIYDAKLGRRQPRAKTAGPESRTLADYMREARTSPSRHGARDRSLDGGRDRRHGDRFAFGSRTPRDLSYLDHIPNEYRVYDVRLETAPIDGERRSKTITFLPSSPSKKPTTDGTTPKIKTATSITRTTTSTSRAPVRAAAPKSAKPASAEKQPREFISDTAPMVDRSMLSAMAVATAAESMSTTATTETVSPVVTDQEMPSPPSTTDIGEREPRVSWTNQQTIDDAEREEQKFNGLTLDQMEAIEDQFVLLPQGAAAEARIEQSASVALAEPVIEAVHRDFHVPALDSAYNPDTLDYPSVEEELHLAATKGDTNIAQKVSNLDDEAVAEEVSEMLSETLDYPEPAHEPSLDDEDSTDYENRVASQQYSPVDSARRVDDDIGEQLFEKVDAKSPRDQNVVLTDPEETNINKEDVEVAYEQEYDTDGMLHQDASRTGETTGEQNIDSSQVLQEDVAFSDKEVESIADAAITQEEQDAVNAAERMEESDVAQQNGNQSLHEVAQKDTDNEPEDSNVHEEDVGSGKTGRRSFLGKFVDRVESFASEIKEKVTSRSRSPSPEKDTGEGTFEQETNITVSTTEMPPEPIQFEEQSSYLNENNEIVSEQQYEPHVTDYETTEEVNKHALESGYEVDNAPYEADSEHIETEVHLHEETESEYRPDIHKQEDVVDDDQSNVGVEGVSEDYNYEPEPEGGEYERHEHLEIGKDEEVEESVGYERHQQLETGKEQEEVETDYRPDTYKQEDTMTEDQWNVKNAPESGRYSEPDETVTTYSIQTELDEDGTIRVHEETHIDHQEDHSLAGAQEHREGVAEGYDFEAESEEAEHHKEQHFGETDQPAEQVPPAEKDDHREYDADDYEATDEVAAAAELSMAHSPTPQIVVDNNELEQNPEEQYHYQHDTNTDQHDIDEVPQITYDYEQTVEQHHTETALHGDEPQRVSYGDDTPDDDYEQRIESKQLEGEPLSGDEQYSAVDVPQISYEEHIDVEHVQPQTEDPSSIDHQEEQPEWRQKLDEFKDKVDDFVSEIKESVEHEAEDPSSIDPHEEQPEWRQKLDEFKEKVDDFASEMKENVEHVSSEIKEKIAEVFEEDHGDDQADKREYDSELDHVERDSLEDQQAAEERLEVIEQAENEHEIEQTAVHLANEALDREALSYSDNKGHTPDTKHDEMRNEDETEVEIADTHVYPELTQTITETVTNEDGSATTTTQITRQYTGHHPSDLSGGLCEEEPRLIQEHMNVTEAAVINDDPTNGNEQYTTTDLDEEFTKAPQVDQYELTIDPNGNDIRVTELRLDTVAVENQHLEEPYHGQDSASPRSEEMESASPASQDSGGKSGWRQKLDAFVDKVEDLADKVMRKDSPDNKESTEDPITDRDIIESEKPLDDGVYRDPLDTDQHTDGSYDAHQSDVEPIKEGITDEGGSADEYRGEVDDEPLQKISVTETTTVRSYDDDDGLTTVTTTTTTNKVVVGDGVDVDEIAVTNGDHPPTRPPVDPISADSDHSDTF